MRVRGWVLSVVLAAMASACASGDDTFGLEPDRYPDGSRRIADAADWATATMVEVDLTEFAFSPSTLRFARGRPYALKLTNTGSTTHRFAAPGFFRAIAARRLIYSDAEASYPFLEAIALESRETKTVHFVPVAAGDFYITCDMPFHGMFGMSGRILID